MYERLQTAQGAFLAELRSTVALFLSFSGLDYDQDDSAGVLLDNYISWVQKVLSRYEGYLLQLTIGDKGSYLLASFGAIRAHEDDPKRALEAALTLQSPPHHLNYIKDVKIGINRGIMHVGAYGGSTRRTYSVQGREANLAARLMTAAEPGQTLVSPQLVAVAGHWYEFDEVGPVPLKGVARPLQLFSVMGKKPQRSDETLVSPIPTQIIGRLEERTVLSSKLMALQMGQSGTVVIEGDPGIGKSMLARTFIDEAQITGFPILLGFGDAIEQATPYHAWRPIFRAIFDVSEDESIIDIQEKMLAILSDDPEMQQLAPLLNAVLPTNFPTIN